MHNDIQRGIGAVLIAFAIIGLFLWLAATRLSPETTLGGGGIAVLIALFVTLAIGAFLLRRKKR